MTTRSSPPRSDRTVIVRTGEPSPSQAPAAVPAGDGGAPEDAVPAADPARTALGDVPLEAVVRLVTLLEGSPDRGDAVGHVLRTLAVERPVEDVALLVAELTRPPRAAGSADAAIRAAVENRRIDDVARLTALLHRPSLRPHCGREAVRAAAAGRPVEDLVDLVGRLARERSAPAVPPVPAVPPAGAVGAGPPCPPGAPAPGEPRNGACPPRPELLPGAATDPGEVPTHSSQDTPARTGRTGGFWPGWLAAAALVVCGAAYFPLRRDGVPLLVYGVTLAASGLCGVLALALALRTGVVWLVTGAVVPAALAATGYVEGRFASAEVSRTLAITVAPPWSAGLTAVCASLACLAALCLLLMVQVAERHPAPRQQGAAVGEP
ncbi:hypothetical protein [Streptomyces tropicalis]|uniref:Uncharacterized protein n=1 Tax=Streptomyces tropicalis TaxID=3034234 RepID=A0ABT6AE22_9ACTN|nr:hypothetical protein [Streptomyces tropicalis]MDF3302905.1 hypothetical protein [Streptomyces tropicalis]